MMIYLIEPTPVMQGKCNPRGGCTFKCGIKPLYGVII
jgi:hypothetical protein